MNRYCENIKCLRKVLPPHIYCEKHEDSSSKPIKTGVHQHQFNIPVEWKDRNQQVLYSGSSHVSLVLGDHIVTKLKCIGCDEERDR